MVVVRAVCSAIPLGRGALKAHCCVEVEALLRLWYCRVCPPGLLMVV